MNKNAMKRLSLPVIPALVVAGTSLNPAAALELGEIEIQSRLGQPLRASIAYALGPNESLAGYCISVAPGIQLNGMPNLGNASVAVGNGVITLTGMTPVREPLMGARLSIQCPYAPKVTRDYLFFVDPAALPGESRYAETSPVVQEPVAAAPSRPAAPPQPVRREREPVAVGSTYRVQPGDSLSDIASRLENRQVGLWQAVNAIFAANPGAFINDDPNQLKAGSLLAIPEATALGGVAPTFAAASDSVAETAPAPVAAVDDTAYLEPAASTVYEPAIERAEPREATSSVTESNLPEVGDIIIDASDSGDAPATAESAVTVEAASSDSGLVVPVVPDAEPAGSAERESATVAAANPPVSQAASSYVIWWTLGGALALIGGLYAWRRRNKPADDDFTPEVAARAPHPMRRATDEDSIEVRIINAPEEATDVDFDLSDDSPTEENLALDADLFEGHGLSDGSTAERAEFGFAETTNLDLELTDDPVGDGGEAGTDIIPPLRSDTGAILESEVLPEVDDYDMSVVMDATKMPQTDEVTERDLKAVLVDDGDKTVTEELYTVSKEVDYEILEQDYEEELTATQALNQEIEKAARELAADMDEGDVTVESERLSRDETAALPIASVTELDVTANMAAGNDDEISSIDDTGINEALTAKLKTQEETTELKQRSADDVDFDDATTEMEIKSGKRAG